jgi:hypothetical protein
MQSIIIDMSLKKVGLIIIMFCCAIADMQAQQLNKYKLADLLHQNKLETNASNQTHLLDDAKNAITTKGIVWLKGSDFKQGSIDIDLRGKDVFLQSFLGIAFHAKDTVNYEVIYFRPFRFQSTDTPTRKWSVQYMSMPGYDYVKLRKEHPGVYENSITPAPQAADWFHATIISKGDSVLVYINHSLKPSLAIKKIDSQDSGMIGLWTSGLSGDFANLSVSK